MFSTEKMKRRLWVAYIAFFVCWSLQSYSLVFRMLNDHELFAREMNGRPYISDFVSFYTSGVLGHRALKERINIYDPDVQSAEFARIVAPVVAELPFFVQSPPTLFVFCMPIALLPTNTAWLTWATLGFTGAIASVYAVFHKDARSRFSLAFAIIATLGSFPMWVSIQLGQTSLFQFAALTAFWLLLMKKRNLAAGLASIFLLVKVQYLPFIVACGLATGKLRYAAGLAIATAVAAVVSILVVGWDNCVEWPRIILHAETTTRFSGVEPYVQQNIRGMLFFIMGGDTPVVHKIVFALCFITAAALVFLWLKMPHVSQKLTTSASETSSGFERSFQVCAAISTMVMLIFSPHTHAHDYLLFTLPCLWLWTATQEFLDEGASNSDKKLAIMIRRLILAYPCLSWLFFLLRLVPITNMVQWFAGYLLILLGLTLRLWFGQRKLQNPSSNLNV